MTSGRVKRNKLTIIFIAITMSVVLASLFLVVFILNPNWRTYKSPLTGISFDYPKGAYVIPLDSGSLTEDVPEQDIKNLDGYVVMFSKPNTSYKYANAQSDKLTDNLELYIQFSEDDEFYEKESEDVRIVKLNNPRYPYMLVAIRSVEGWRSGGAPIDRESQNYQVMRQIFESINY